ncbi:MAG: extracellular solute-binding protein [Phycisphaerae bacterium]|nr:extracellular solute-binding protein [Phycisphaerae bacterium]
MKVVVWLLTALVLVGIVYSFSTCQSESSQGRVVITIFDWNFAVQIKLDRELIKIFETDNPDIKVLLVTGQEDKYQTMVTAKVAPDVVATGYGHIPFYAKCGSILPLNDLIEADEKKREAIVSLDKIADPAARRKAIMALDESVAADAARRNALSALTKSLADGRKFSLAEYFDSDKDKILALDKISNINAKRKAIFVELDESVAGGAAKKRAIASLDKALAEGREFSCAEYFGAKHYFNRDDYFPATLEALTYDGKIYALPSTGSPVAIIYNKNLFDEYNAKSKKSGKPLLEYPNDNWTWDDYRRAAVALTQEDKKGRIDVFGGAMGFHRNRFPMFVWQSGGEVINKEKTHCLMDSPEAIRGIQFMYDMLWKYKCAPTAQTQMEGVSEQNDSVRFKEKRIAMLLTTRYAYSELLEEGKLLTDFEWDIALPPKNPDTGIRTSIYIGGGWMIPSQTHNLNEAWRVAKFLVGAQSNEKGMEAGRAMTAHMGVAEKMTNVAGHKPDHDYLWIDVMKDCRPKDFEYRMGVAGPKFDKAMEEIYELPYDRRKPRQACINCTRYFNEALKALREKEQRDREEQERKNRETGR